MDSDLDQNYMHSIEKLIQHLLYFTIFHFGLVFPIIEVLISLFSYTSAKLKLLNLVS